MKESKRRWAEEKKQLEQSSRKEVEETKRQYELQIKSLTDELENYKIEAQKHDSAAEEIYYHLCNMEQREREYKLRIQSAQTAIAELQ